MHLLKKEALYLKTNVGINYNYPTFNDLYWNPGGNKNLKPEQAKMWEGGLSFTKKLKQTTIFTEFTVYYAKVKDWIIWQPTSYGYWQPNNLKEVENKGLEANISIHKTIKRLQLITKIGYAYTKSTNIKAQNNFDNSLNNQLIYVPFHKINYNLNILYRSLSINYSYNYTGKRFITTDNNWYLPANFISDVSVSKTFKIKHKTSIYGTFKVNNLFNQEYQSIAWRAMPQRNYLIAISYLFN